MQYIDIPILILGMINVFLIHKTYRMQKIMNNTAVLAGYTAVVVEQIIKQDEEANAQWEMQFEEVH